jgi:hypothetical protein
MQTVIETPTYRLLSDGTEEVFFSDDEWGFMMQDPVYFGYACRNGHRIREDDPFTAAFGCPTCYADGESDSEPTPPHFPTIRCGHCGDRHVGVGAVRRCGLGS